jgi:tRNA threonylcarbamoyladenosine biosynthesis protein TsaE
VTTSTSTQRLTLPATEADAADVLALTRHVFAAYGDLQPQPSSLRETVDDVAGDLARHGGLVVRDGEVVDGRTVPGRLLAVTRFSEHDGGFWLRRVAVHPDVRREGLASRLADAAEDVARQRGYGELRVGVRTPLREVAEFWRRRGFRQVGERAYWVELARPLPLRLMVPTTADMQALGSRLAGLLRPGDLVVLSGDLGAGKTTLTRGLGSALGVRGAVTSPTFVIARVHPPTGEGPALVHVDAYRLGSLAEVDHLDLDASLDEAVTVVEWGEGMVEGLSESRLELSIRRRHDDGDETRTVTVRAVGDRWVDVDLAAALS